MSRLIQEKIKQPLAEELLFGKLVGRRRGAREPEGRPAELRTGPAPPKVKAAKKAKAGAKKGKTAPEPSEDADNNLRPIDVG